MSLRPAWKRLSSLALIATITTLSDINAAPNGDRLGHRFGIAGQHHALNPHALEPLDGLTGLLAHDVGQDDGCMNVSR